MNVWSRRRWVPALLAAASGFVPLKAAQGQTRVVPQIGLYVPATSFGAVTADGVDGAVELGKKESTRAYGLGLEWGGGGFLGLRTNLAYATSSDVPISGVGCTVCSSRSTMLAATAGLVVRPLRLLFIEPYLIGGMGLKRYDFSRADFGEILVDDRNVRAWHLGVGGELDLGPLSGVVEISDYISDRDSQVPGHRLHDFIVSVGIGIGG
ncbi:MAG: hypothetical protein R3E10_15240 [Gemmatimonadota bacterium]